MKIGRYEVGIDENDLILDNGACYQILTQMIRKGWNEHPLKISNTQFNKLHKQGIVYTNDDMKKAAEKKYGYNGLTYWKFDINKMDELGMC